MKKTFMTILFAFSVFAVSAQDTMFGNFTPSEELTKALANSGIELPKNPWLTWEHYATLLSQFLTTELGIPISANELYYSTFHQGYSAKVKSGLLPGKSVSRGLVALTLTEEKGMAAARDSAYKAMSKAEVLDLLDREVDTAWLVEKVKTDAAINKYTHLLDSLTLYYRPPILASNEYRTFLEAVRQDIKIIRESSDPNINRQLQYNKIHAEILKKCQELSKYMVSLAYVEKQRASQASASGSTLKRGRKSYKSATTNAQTRFVLASRWALQK